MGIDFHDEKNKYSYTTRKASDSWVIAVKTLIEVPEVKRAVDIGTGGGIYAKELADLGIPKVTGVDFSESMLDGAKINCKMYNEIEFSVGTAYDTLLPNQYAELMLGRALIHHLDDLAPFFQEAHRILTPGGSLLIQDRTPEDCFLKGDSQHIRGFIFSLFPHLRKIEQKRRYSSTLVKQELEKTGFHSLKEIKIWEEREIYTNKEDLFEDIKARTGRSILHELSDEEILSLVNDIDHSIPDGRITEQDRWTIWKASK
ncbi:class I SAM-dependent methyltransferase [Shouchella shacheensis]|uniref:class I SAM-dependent methyltransferase n=1 Tax=Shouchella shacheensis TaxID=1649580 RepID=UPI0007404D5F|nr:class I SAM-dependent methyltransferase [Shouchella shacheensis]